MKQGEIIEAIAGIKSRSAWARGVAEYAGEIAEALDPDEDYSSPAFLEKELLNGALSWAEYSRGGCSLIYDADIAERLCTPSELKRCKGGRRAPNREEGWLDVQTRALYQAAELVVSIVTRRC